MPRIYPIRLLSSSAKTFANLNRIALLSLKYGISPDTR
jgi:hypothetical protein